MTDPGQEGRRSSTGRRPHPSEPDRTCPSPLAELDGPCPSSFVELDGPCPSPFAEFDLTRPSLSAEPDPRPPSPLVELDDPRLARAGVRVILKRDDLIHPLLPGNKWRKLKYNLARAAELGHETLLTFGGAYSNHVRAVAAAGARFGFRTVGVIRGEEHLPLNDVLAFAADSGMRLVYLDRTTYRAKDTAPVVEALRRRFGRFYLLPEGGSNEQAVRGCAELPGEIDVPFDVVCCPVGTGGTLAGIAAGLAPGRRALGFSVLRGARFLADDVARLQEATYGEVSANWTIDHDFHAGGYARRAPELDAFVDDFAHRHGMSLDRIYVAKMMWGVFTLAERGALPGNTTVVAVVTGAMEAASS